MEPIRISPYTLILVAAVVGFLLGLIPLILGIRRKKATLGAIGLICSTIGGAISGIFLIVPVLGVFIYLILKSDSSTDVKTDRTENL